MADPSGQPVVHGLKPMDFEDDLIVLRTHVCITPSFCKKKRRATCTMHVYLACPLLAPINRVFDPEAEYGS